MAQDSGSKGPSARHCVVSLSKTKTLIFCLVHVLVLPKKIGNHSDMTEKLLT